MNSYPRTLVISNNSFSLSNSNGRTLGLLFKDWPKEKLAQFCISTTEPDYTVCDNYYLLTDKSILNAFKRFSKGKRCEIDENFGTAGNIIVGGKKYFKTPLKALARHLVWSGRRWNSKQFQDWVQAFDPEIVVVMNSDATFILDIASYISKKQSIPLVMYNTEGFYFLKRMYSHRSGYYSELVLKLYQSIYRRHFRKMMKRVVLSIHLNSLLEKDYREEFGGNHMVLYTGSELRFDSSNLHTDNPTFTYLGNFGFDRPSALIEIAEVLQSINPNYILNIYGRIPSPDIKAKFDSCPGVIYKGVVPYGEVVRVMYGSTILFHAESQSPLYEDALRYGFSTKIADSISSGHPFLMYSSPNIAGAKYIIETGAGWFAKDQGELKNQVVAILTDETQRGQILGKAREIAEENHTTKKIAKAFRMALYKVYAGNNR